MFSKLFRKKPVIAQVAPAPAAAKGGAQPTAAADARGVWVARLQTCLGDDAALLALAREAPLVEIKHSAVAALGSEEALKQAEREFRTLNQGVHRLAKQRHHTLVVQRESRAQAGLLIETAAALCRETMVPANRLVELDTAWRTLDANTLTEALLNEYAELSAQLTRQLRERGEQQQALTRWSARTRPALQQLTTSCASFAAGGRDETELVAAVAVLQSALADQPAFAAATGGDDNGRLEEACHTAIRRAGELVAEQAAQRVQFAAQEAAREAAEADALRQAPAKPARPAKPKSDPVSQQALAGRVSAAEEALAAGHLNDARAHLMAIDQAHDEGTEKLASPALRSRIEAVKAEFARLKGWQHWGGGRVRDDLVDEAEALARVVGPSDETPAAKINIKQHAEAIEQLRLRWKELDRLGGAGGKALWPRFDAALKTAYLPVAEQQAKLKAARDENLAARQRLIAQLDDIAVEPGDDGGKIDWREIVRTLEHFEGEWRKLGPVDHTVPHKARDGLLESKAARLARIEAPLQQARLAAKAEREQFISRAQALSAGTARDSLARVRELQAAWQQHAKALPLSRSVENALWAEFKAATDAVFKQREAQASARDGEFKAHQAAREALIERLDALAADALPDEIEQVVASVDREWRHAGEVSPALAGRLDERFRKVRAAALERVSDARRQVWHASCDALLDRLARCETLAADQAPAHEATGDDLLLRLEVALDMPSPPEYQPARRELKLRALKQTLEGRQAGPADDVASLLIEALRCQPTAAQRERLHQIITTLRERPGISLGDAL